MRQRDESEVVPFAHSIEEPEVAQAIEEILKALEPYPELALLREYFVTGVKLAYEECSRGDLKILRTAVKELRYGFKVFAPYRDVRKVSIFGSSRRHPGHPEYETAVEVARRLAGAGFMVVTGAGPGIMEAGHKGAGREHSFGLNILLPFEQVANPYILGDPKLINFLYFFTRKLFFVKESSGIILMPGGYGTLDEGFEVLTLIQTGKNEPTPVVMLDAPGGSYWKDWYEFVSRQLFQRGYISPEDEALFLITDSVDRAVEEIAKFYRRFHSSRYVNRKQRLVLRLKEPLDEERLRELNREFQGILAAGSIEVCPPFPEEADEPELLDLPRLVLEFNRHNFGRLRQLIDGINA